MSVEDDLLRFAEGLRHEVLSRAAPGAPTGGGRRRENRFTEVMLEYLAEAGETDDGALCYCAAAGLKVNGYATSDDGSCLDLFVSHCTLAMPPATLEAAEVGTHLARLRGFVSNCLGGLHLRLPPASPAFDLASRIHGLRGRPARFRLFLLTDCVCNVGEIPPGRIGDVVISYQVWDVWRLFQRRTAGRPGEAIDVDFSELPGGPLVCLRGSPAGGPYECYLGCVPGETLVALYERFGPRLLERNVRTFLQARGGVNRSIRRTILAEPGMFLAYNNGLSATAERAEVSEVGGTTGTVGAVALLRVTDLRIVNGGQTTGSLYHACRRDGADVSAVRVPIKLTVLREPARVAAVVPRISECANSQNRIDAADFSANDPFHVRIQELSRAVWAPAPGGGEGPSTKWYYERARGQYEDDRGRQETDAHRQAWEQVYPPGQMFTKTDLAKYENTWDQLPHLVSRGGQKNFREFTARLATRIASPLVPGGAAGVAHVDEGYFRRLVAKAILFRGAEDVISGQGIGGYRANVVTYTLACLAHVSADRINLERVWRQQGLPPGLSDAIAKVSARVFRHITSPPGGGGTTEWCKREACWQELKTKFKVPARKVS